MDISVVVPSYRSEHTVGRTIESVLAEGVRPQNIFIIEDGAYDGTSEIVGRYKGVKLVSLDRNVGAPKARNIGLGLVETKFTMFLDADDYIENGLLSGLLVNMEAEDADIGLGPWLYDGVDIKRGELRYSEAMPNNQRVIHWLNVSCVPTCSVMWRTSAVRSIGGWDERLRKNQDGELMVRALLNELKVAVSKEGNGVYWHHSSPYRISTAKADDVFNSADIVYTQISDRIESWNDTKEFSFKYQFGRYCCKMSWEAFGHGRREDGLKWRTRAESYGFSRSGYSSTSRALCRVLGFERAAKLKVKLRPLYINYVR